MRDKYWMVFVEGTSGCKVKHESLSMAQDEAERLARFNEGKKVFVLQAIKYCRTVSAPLGWFGLEEE